MTATDSTPAFQLRWYLSVAVALFAFVIVGVYSMRMARDTSGYDEDQARQRAEKLTAMQAQDAKTLGTPDWVDKDKGIVRIPIDEAMAQEIPVLAAKPLAMGAAIPGAVTPPPANLPASPMPTAPLPASGATPPTAKPTK